VLVLQKKFAAGYARVLKNSISFGDQLLPVFALGIGCIGNKDAVVRRIFVGRDVELVLKEVGLVEKVLAGGDFNGRILRLAIEQVHLGLSPSLFDSDQKPTVVFGKLDRWNILRVAAFTEDEGVFGRIVADLVKEDFGVVNLFAFRYIALFWMARVVKAGIVFKPSEAAEASAFDDIGQSLIGRSLEDVERALLASVGRGAVGDILPVVGDVPPIERNRSVGGERVRVEQDTVLSTQALADIEDGLVLTGIAARVEVIVASKLRGRNRSDGEKLRQTCVDFCASGKRIENGARVGKLFFNVELGVGVVRVFKVAVGIDDLVALDCVFDGSDFCLGRASRGRNISGHDQSGNADKNGQQDKQQTGTSQHRHLCRVVDAAVLVDEVPSNRLAEG